jgi:hypothetical protein
MSGMSDENGMWAVTAVARCMRDTLAAQFESLYLLSSPAGAAAADLVVVVADAFWTPRGDLSSLHRLRRAFTPVWQQAGSHFTQVPLLVTTSGLAHYCLLHPVFGRRLAQEGRLVAGHETRPPLRDVDRTAEAAYWATESRRLSAVLAPGLMEPPAAAQRLAQLHSAASLWRRQAVAGDEPAILLLAELQERLDTLLPAHHAGQAEPLAGAPPLLAHLRAIYERGGTLILVLPRLTGDELAAVDWPEVAVLFQDSYSELQLTTPTQFLLSLQEQEPLHYTVGSYRHLWGEDPLAGLEVERRLVLRDAARLPAHLLARDLPQAYLAGEDVYRVIHDLQNRLLNIQLQHELLARMLPLPPITLPALPDQGAPGWQRIDAIVALLYRWADYYRREMEQCAS